MSSDLHETVTHMQMRLRSVQCKFIIVVYSLRSLSVSLGDYSTIRTHTIIYSGGFTGVLAQGLREYQWMEATELSLTLVNIT